MIYTTPLRRTIRHLEQRLRMEGETFIEISLLAAVLTTAKVLIILFVVQFVHTTRRSAGVTGQSG